MDLFSGSGAIGIEALSRGAEAAVFVEKIPKHVPASGKIFHLQNFQEHGKLLNMDALQALRFLEGKGVYDCIFMDPPYEKGLEAQVLEYLSGSSLVDENTLLIVEADLKTDFAYVESMGYQILRSKRI